MKTSQSLFIFAAGLALTLNTDYVLAGKIESTLLAIERARFAAMAGPDIAALAPLLAADLSYCHSNGRCENRRELLASISSGATRYRKIELINAVARAGSSLATLTGQVRITLQSGNTAASEIQRLPGTKVNQAVGWRIKAHGAECAAARQRAGKTSATILGHIESVAPSGDVVDILIGSAAKGGHVVENRETSNRLRRLTWG